MLQSRKIIGEGQCEYGSVGKPKLSYSDGGIEVVAKGFILVSSEVVTPGGEREPLDAFVGRWRASDFIRCVLRVPSGGSMGTDKWTGTVAWGLHHLATRVMLP